MKQQKFLIRRETEADYAAAEHITREAFWNVNVPGCNEHYYLHCMRSHRDYLPALCFVAEMDGEIVGSIHWLRAWLADEAGQEKEIATFGPLSVLPAYQRQGIGKALIAHSLAAAKQQGIDAVVIFGNPDNYVSSGFVSCLKHRIALQGGFLPAAMLVCELREGALAEHSWEFRESDAGACLADAAAAAAFEAGFAPKQKAWRPSQEEFFIHSRSVMLQQ